MASTIPLMPFLRPLPAPRLTTVRGFLRFSTSARPCEQPTAYSPAASSKKSRVRVVEDPNLTASRTADAAYPPSSMRSDPRPKKSRASQRASLPPKDRPYPTRTVSHQTKEVEPMIPGAVKSLEPERCAPNLPYYVNRTKSNELPVYDQRRREGGSYLRTLIRRIDGNVEILRDELRTSLGLPAADIVVNPITRNIQIKGHHKKSVLHYLWERRF